MEFSPGAVEFFESEAITTQPDGFKRIKIRMIVGYVIGNQFLHSIRLGAITSVVDECQDWKGELLRAARRTYEAIPTVGDLLLPVYGYHLGLPVEFDDEGEPVGDWPKLGELRLPYQDKILMPEGKLPEQYTHLVNIRRW
jgi:hypothetical protein